MTAMPAPTFSATGTARAEVNDAALGALLYRNDAPDGTEDLLPPQPDLWAVAPALGRFLSRVIVERRVRNLLEFGAGSSSVISAHALSMIGGGRLTSLEAHPEWCAERWARVERHRDVDARLVGSSLALRVDRCGVRYEYAQAAGALPGRGPFDFVLVDGPPWFYGRDGAMHSAIAHLAPGAIVVVDDAARQGERRTVVRWLRTFPGLHMAAYDPGIGRGIAVLTFDGNAERVPHAAIALRTLPEAAALAWRRRRETAAH